MAVYSRCQFTQYATLLRGFAEHHGTSLLAASAAACAGRATRLRSDKRRVRGIASVGGRPHCRRRAAGGLPQGNNRSGGRSRRCTRTKSATPASGEGPLQLQFRARDGSGVGGRGRPERHAVAVHLAILDGHRLVAATATAAGAFHRARQLNAVLLQREQAVGAHTEAAASSSTRRIFSPPGTSPTPVWPAVSVSRTMFRVKNGPWAPLKFSSIESCPATGITRIVAITGVCPKV